MHYFSKKTKVFSFIKQGQKNVTRTSILVISEELRLVHPYVTERFWVWRNFLFTEIFCTPVRHCSDQNKITDKIYL